MCRVGDWLYSHVGRSASEIAGDLPPKCCYYLLGMLPFTITTNSFFSITIATSSAQHHCYHVPCWRSALHPCWRSALRGLVPTHSRWRYRTAPVGFDQSLCPVEAWPCWRSASQPCWRLAWRSTETQETFLLRTSALISKSLMFHRESRKT